MRHRNDGDFHEPNTTPNKWVGNISGALTEIGVDGTTIQINGSNLLELVAGAPAKSYVYKNQTFNHASDTPAYWSGTSHGFTPTWITVQVLAVGGSNFVSVGEACGAGATEQMCLIADSSGAGNSQYYAGKIAGSDGANMQWSVSVFSSGEIRVIPDPSNTSNRCTGVNIRVGG